MTGPTRVLIVDDSASMRAVLARALSADPDIEVVGMAPEPHTARAMIKELNPDVVTLDVEMPGMDGLSFLEKIMRLRPMPVIMCSTLTARGAEVTIEALRLGAVDCIAKPAGNPLEIARDAALLRKMVKAAARSSVRQGPSRLAPVASQPGLQRDVVIAVGASTGGVEALFSVIGALPPDCPPVLVVQHMPAAFTNGFAARLDRESRVSVVEAVTGTPIQRGTVYIAPGGSNHMELVGGTNGHIRLRPGEPVGGHRPSVDVLFHSVAPLGAAAVGVILTGMGNDGAAGMQAMRLAGARTLGQNQASCVVYGMPRAAFELGAVEREVSLSAMPEAILAACRK
ncbi:MULTISPECIES: protein-glutamate methylesterase/protein-glutamine glutaminase [Sphingomonas]|uniref:Protein-glutamate methylesterase/protein-glutamine glutaminase n=1 Tax=Edaphosphingomonas fennica TaxID=114404 RepID=A0A2T4I7B6_9SPHN|nr:MULTISPECIES: chemotaxis response regulator protein-glutamate methylesterase [Sphingomonas]AGH49056.1 chemotaxis-specific protein-glutamate methyltransferase [Sphingomonas sp. MM-1]MDX3885279.1 chemotaxis response regulator protein-glutamate methylesterase [Sphingomonas sp.]PTD26957.1 chemotaxis response regulator protein-glutamate methylesterase [Sphingomonas fennica]